MVPADVAKRVTGELVIPTIGIGAGPDTDAQVLVWSDMAGMNRGRKPKFVKQYADLGEILLGAARAYADEVRAGSTRTRSTPTPRRSPRARRDGPQRGAGVALAAITSASEAPAA